MSMVRWLIAWTSTKHPSFAGSAGPEALFSVEPFALLRIGRSPIILPLLNTLAAKPALVALALAL